jgi:hypothetical protein
MSASLSIQWITVNQLKISTTLRVTAITIQFDRLTFALA